MWATVSRSRCIADDRTIVACILESLITPWTFWESCTHATVFSWLWRIIAATYIKSRASCRRKREPSGRTPAHTPRVYTLLSSPRSIFLSVVRTALCVLYICAASSTIAFPSLPLLTAFPRARAHFASECCPSCSRGARQQGPSSRLLPSGSVRSLGPPCFLPVFEVIGF